MKGCMKIVFTNLQQHYFSAIHILIKLVLIVYLHQSYNCLQNKSISNIQQNTIRQDQFDVKDLTDQAQKQTMEDFHIRDVSTNSQELYFAERLLESQNQNYEDSLYSDALNQSYRFIPDHRLLIQQINKAQQQAEFYQQQFMHMKAVNESIIDAIKRVFSIEVAHELQQAMKMKQPNGFTRKTSGQASQDAKKYNFQSNISQNSLNNRSRFSNFNNYSKHKSKELTQTLYEIMVNQKIWKNQNFAQNLSYQNRKKQIDDGADQFSNENIQNLKIKVSAKKLQFSNTNKSNSNSFFVLTPSKKSENSICLSPKKQNISKKQKQRSPMSPLFINNKNLGILTDMKDISQISTNRTNTPQSIATSLLCEVCHHCFTPNQFFRHIKVCSHNPNINMPSQQSLQSIKSLNDTQNLQNQRAALNYTIMMKNLLQIRNEIESQIQMLKTSKQKIDRATLRKKLQKDLQKVTKIITKKQRQLKGFCQNQSGIGSNSSIPRKKKYTIVKK